MTRYWLTVDPGETTGWSIWKNKELIAAGQTDLWAFIDAVDAWLSFKEPPYAAFDLTEGVDGFEMGAELGALVVEDWQLYPWELQNLSWDKCRTARGIGALELLCRQHNIPIYLQAAAIKEAAIAAGAEELFLTPRHENRHLNDAIMHGVFYTTKEGKAPC